MASDLTSNPRVLADLLPRTLGWNLLLVVTGAAVVAVAAQVSLLGAQMASVAYAGQTLAVLLVGATLGAARGMLSLTLYAAAALAGLPILPGGGQTLSVTGLTPSLGYVIGFIAAGGLVGWLAQRGWTRTRFDTALAMVLGTVAIYAIGVPYLKLASGTSWSWAVEKGMAMFMLPDALKIVIASLLLPLLWRVLGETGDSRQSTDPDADEQKIDLADDRADAHPVTDAVIEAAQVDLTSEPVVLIPRPDTGHDDDIIIVSSPSPSSPSPSRER